MTQKEKEKENVENEEQARVYFIYINSGDATQNKVIATRIHTARTRTPSTNLLKSNIFSILYNNGS
jgi:hypothetical protein